MVNNGGGPGRWDIGLRGKKENIQTWYPGLGNVEGRETPEWREKQVGMGSRARHGRRKMGQGGKDDSDVRGAKGSRGKAEPEILH